jgi:hydroxyethylthiazole kinase-like uncharacterized protein yjeF
VIRAHTVAQVRAAEDRVRAGLPPGALLQRAATALAVGCAERLGRVYGSRVLLLVGSGDNGADALHAGARLARRGAVVSAVLTGEPVADALAALRTAGGRVVDAPVPADLVVDGLVGIGGRGALRPAAAALAAQVAGHDVVAVDLPSGVDADTGEVAGAVVRADLTLVFGTCKPGLLVGAGRAAAGRVELVDIGLGPELPPAPVEQLQDADAAALHPRGHAGSDKYTRGVLGVVAGSQTYPGAAVLCVGAAATAGAGMVRFAGAPHPAEQVRLRWPEAVVTDLEGADVVTAGRVQAWVVGPGLGTDATAAAAVEAVLAQDVPVLVDADALTVCAQRPQWLRRRSAPTLLTPHDRSSSASARRSPPTASAAPRGSPPSSASRCCSRATPRWCRVRTARRASTAPARPRSRRPARGRPVRRLRRAARAGARPARRRLRRAHLHGRAGALAARGASVPASALVGAWADAVRSAGGRRTGACHTGTP